MCSAIPVFRPAPPRLSRHPGENGPKKWPLHLWIQHRSNSWISLGLYSITQTNSSRVRRFCTSCCNLLATRAATVFESICMSIIGRNLAFPSTATVSFQLASKLASASHSHSLHPIRCVLLGVNLQDWILALLDKAGGCTNRNCQSSWITSPFTVIRPEEVL